MNTYFFSVKYTVRNNSNKIIFEVKNDFKENGSRNFFEAKDLAISEYKRDNPESFAPIFSKLKKRKFRGGGISVDKKIFLVETSSDGQRIEHPWMGASEDPEDQELVEFDLKISKEKRHEINSKKSLTLEDYLVMDFQEKEWQEVPLSYHIIKTESGQNTESGFIEHSLKVLKHHDYTISRQKAVEEYEKLIKDPATYYQADGIANWNAETGIGYILDFNVQYSPEGKSHTLYSTFIPFEEERMENRKSEKRYFDYYGYEYPEDGNRKMPWL